MTKKEKDIMSEPPETPTAWVNIGTRVMPERGVAKVKRVRFAFLEETSPPPSPSPSPSTTKTATMSSLFGNLGANNKPAGTGGLFGAAGSTPASTQSSTPSLFGTAPTGATGAGASSGGLFGAQQQQNNKPTLSLFGNNNAGTSNATAQPATSTPSLFGNTSNATQQPATTAPNLFGGATATGGNNLFGSTTNAQPSGNTLGGNNQGEIQNFSVVKGPPLIRTQHSAQVPHLLDSKSRMPDPFTLTT